MTSFFKIKRSKHKQIIILYTSFHILCPNVARRLKNVLKRQKKTNLNKKNTYTGPLNYELVL